MTPHRRLSPPLAPFAATEARSAGHGRPVRTKWVIPRQSTAPGSRNRLTVVTPRRRPAVVKNRLVQAKIMAAVRAIVSPKWGKGVMNPQSTKTNFGGSNPLNRVDSL